GFLIAWVLGLLERLKMKTQLRQQNKQISSMEEELDSLKNTPQLPIQAESSTDS
ncbi:MAG: LapA family protein, partial [Nitrospina sp.]|nr:LapA family protein [Nitrospina sp.]